MSDIIEKTELEKYLLGERTEELTPQEIKSFFSKPITSETNFILFTALKGQISNFANNSVINIIDNAKTKDSLLPFCLALRFGASPNGYINDPKNGPCHVLVYVLNTIGNNNLIDETLVKAFIAALVISNTNLKSPAFDPAANYIGSSENPGSKTVSDWAKDRYEKYHIENITSSQEDLKKYVGEELLNTLSIYLDKSSYKGRKYVSQDILTAISSFSFVVWDSIPLNRKADSSFGNRYPNECIEKYCSEGFSRLLKKGLYVSYIIVNKIIIQMKKNAKNKIFTDELSKILISAIRYGAPLDQSQLNMIADSDPDIIASINQAYSNKSFWEKECTSENEEISEKLKNIAISLGVYTDSKGKICESLKTINNADKQLILEANRKKQEGKLIYELGRTTEFTNGQVPDLVCSNVNSLVNNYFDYNDLDMSYYRDVSGKIWCYSSDNYETLLEKSKNKDSDLPRSFIEQIREKNERIKSMKNYEMKTFPKALNELTEKDSINNNSSNKFYERFKQLALEKSVSISNIESATPSQFERALSAAGTSVNLKDLNLDVVRYTVSRLVLSFDSSKVSSFFENLSSGSVH